MTQGLLSMLPPLLLLMRCTVAKGDNGSSRDKQSYWTLKISLITFFIALLFSFIADGATNRGNLIFALILLVILIIINILFDGIAVAVTACNKAPLASMASRKIKGSKMAIRLKSSADVVASICADVIGDICGIVSGACVIVIGIELLEIYPAINATILTILFSSVVAAVIVGGKAAMKSFAINNSKEILMFVSRIITVFVKESRL